LLQAYREDNQGEDWMHAWELADHIRNFPLPDLQNTSPPFLDNLDVQWDISKGAQTL